MTPRATILQIALHHDVSEQDARSLLAHPFLEKFITAALPQKILCVTKHNAGNGKFVLTLPQGNNPLTPFVVVDDKGYFDAPEYKHVKLTAKTKDVINDMHHVAKEIALETFTATLPPKAVNKLSSNTPQI